ncbi:MAG: SRPBCC domain-containing protein [Pseudomonadota bacterium]
MIEGENWVRIERFFDAEINDVWSMWTKADLFASWYGPNGMSVAVDMMELKVGGTRKIRMSMSTPQRDMTMYFTGVFKEIQSPTRLVYTESMCTEDGTLIAPESVGMPGGSPQVTEVIVELTKADSGTNMVMIHLGVPAGTAGEGGWQQAIAKLGDRLAATG